jgi:hypothetical protein
MKRLLYITSTLFFIMITLFANPYTVLANEGDGELEKEVNGYHVTLTSQNEWVKGGNTIFVTLTDSMGMPVSKADVEILITPKSDEHAEDLHGTEPQQDAVPEMDMGHDHSQENVTGTDMSVPVPATETPHMPTHKEENASPMAMMESDEPGMYMLETHLESSAEHDVHVMFHVNGEMLQADFVVQVSGTSSRAVVLWSFGVINVALITSASIMKKRPVTMGGK